MSSERARCRDVEPLPDELRHLCIGAGVVFMAKSVSSGTIDVFDSKTAPEIEIKDYFIRAVSFVPLSKPQFLLALEYVDRYLCDREACLSLTSMHRLAATAMVLAHKFDCDFPLDDMHYGRIMGLEHFELMTLQMTFMKRINYRLMYPEFLRGL